MNVWNYTMAADEARVIARSREEVDFFKEIDGFGIIRFDLLSEAIELLGKSDLNAEIGGLGEFGDFQRLGPGNAPCLHPRGAKMVFGFSRDRVIVRGDEFAVPQQVFSHPRMLAPHRTVGEPRPAAVGNPACRARYYRAVDDRQAGLETLN